MDIINDLKARNLFADYQEAIQNNDTQTLMNIGDKYRYTSLLDDSSDNKADINMAAELYKIAAGKGDV